MTPSPAGTDRLFFLDHLRIIALGLLLPYHVGMYYVSWPWHVKSAHSAWFGPMVEPWLRLTSPWRMSLLFLIAGAATALMLSRQGASVAWLRQRAARLLWPLLTGVVLLVPPQAYFEAVQRFGYDGGWWAFLLLYFSADGRFCDRLGCLILPTWNHLWFLPYLAVYTLLGWSLLRRWPGLIDATAARLPRLLAGPRLWLLPLAWLVSTRLLLRPWFPETHALVDDLFTHSQQAAFFVLGALLAGSGRLWMRLVSWRWLALLLALSAWLALLLLPGLLPGVPWPLRAVLVSLQQWAAVVAALGWARHRLDRDSGMRRRLTEAVFPVYLLHQTVIVVAAVALAPLVLPPLAEAGLLLALTLGVSVLGWLLLRRVARLRRWFGMSPAARPGTRELASAERAVRPASGPTRG